MGKGKRWRTIPFSHNRKIIAASSTVSRERNTIHLIGEIDISNPRQLIAEYYRQHGIKLSLTAYIATCLGKAILEFPEINSFRKGWRQVFLDELTISILMERLINGEAVPEPVAIRNAGMKNYPQINEELRQAQLKEVKQLGEDARLSWIRFLPDFLLRTFIRLSARSINMQLRFGVAAVTSVGMFGSGAMWPLPLSSATVTVAVGSIVKRPVMEKGKIMEREHLCLSLTFNHDIIDGAPAARFVQRFSELLSDGSAIITN